MRTMLGNNTVDINNTIEGRSLNSFLSIKLTVTKQSPCGDPDPDPGLEACILSAID